MEADLLIHNGHAGVALVYLGASLGAGLVAAWGGLTLGRSFAGRAGPGPA